MPGCDSPYIWDRLNAETEDEFNWFRWYYDMGPTRSFQKLALVTGQDEFDLRELSRRFAWDLRIDQRQTYQTAVLSQWFQDDQRTMELVQEAALNETLAKEIMEITRGIAEERAAGEAIPIDRRIRRAEKLQAMKNQMVKQRGERSSGGEGGITINVLPRDIVEAIEQGKHMDLTAFEKTEVKEDDEDDRAIGYSGSPDAE